MTPVKAALAIGITTTLFGGYVTLANLAGGSLAGGDVFVSLPLWSGPAAVVVGIGILVATVKLGARAARQTESHGGQ